MKCSICHKSFEPSKRNPYQIYCSVPCNKRAYEARNRVRLNREANEKYHSLRSALVMPNFICKHCGVKFIGKSLRPRNFCSKKCLKNNWMKTHKEYMRKVCKEWADKNIEKVRSAGRENARRRKVRCRDSILHNAHIQQDKRRGANGSHTLAEWNELKHKFNFSCACCGRKEPQVKLTRDHIIPIKLGGTNYISNIQLLCFSCNSSKSTGLNCRRTH